MARLPGIASLLRRIYGSIYYGGALELFHTQVIISLLRSAFIKDSGLRILITDFSVYNTVTLRKCYSYFAFHFGIILCPTDNTK